MVEKIPYLMSLGITTVELMPVFQFDAQEAPAELTNYWGYAPMSFFAPHRLQHAARRAAPQRRRVPRHGQGAAPRRHR
ncbi:MAG: hypothetical protein U1F25_16775 [Rubrivivax sp.]